MAFGVANIERQQLINNVVMLAKAAKEFGIPAILTAVETESFSGYIWPQLMDVFPGQQPIERSSMNSWDDPAFRKAVEATGKKNVIIAGLWTEVCVTWPTLNMLNEGYNIYIVEDACGATSRDEGGVFHQGSETDDILAPPGDEEEELALFPERFPPAQKPLVGEIRVIHAAPGKQVVPDGLEFLKAREIGYDLNLDFR